MDSAADGRELEALAHQAGCHQQQYTIYRKPAAALSPRPRPAGFLFVVDVLEVKSEWVWNHLLDATDIDETVCLVYLHGVQRSRLHFATAVL